MTESKTIFLVDDDVTNLRTGSSALDEHYNVLTLNSGPRLLKVLEKNIPDLILLDVEMPEMNGYETIKQVKSKDETSCVPVIFLTAKSTSDNEIEGLSLGAVAYIIKPFSPPLLRKRIEMHLLIESQKQELLNLNYNLQKVVDDKIKEVFKLQNAILKTMAELVESRDDVTGSHIGRTQAYLGILLDSIIEYGLYKNEISSLNIYIAVQSAQLHDIGKIAIKDNILQKPGKLTDEEFEIMKKHTTFGGQVIEKIQRNMDEQEFLRYAKILAETHHERWDGSGYPNNLKGENIPLLGRIMAIADVYDALVTERPYKKAFTHEHAIDIISNGKGTHFDPVLVDLFLNVSDKFKKINIHQY